MTIPDTRFEADFLRAALLLGLVREREVTAWADALLPAADESIALLADVALARPELTTLREALRPLAAPSDPRTVAAALLTFLATNSTAVALGLPDRIGVLSHLRREDILPPTTGATIKLFEDRWMLASAGVTPAPTLDADVDRWLEQARGPGFYRVVSERAEEQIALLGALSRLMVRERRASSSGQRAGSAWVLPGSVGAGPVLMLNEPLWRLVAAAFSPLPLGSGIPYPSVPANAVLVLDEATALPMGVDDAAHLLAAI